MNFNTMSKVNSSLTIKIFSMLVFMAVAFSLDACAAPVQGSLQSGQDSTEASGEKTFTFHKMSNGKDNLWKVVFEDGKIVKLYKNGSRIPKENIDEFQSMVDDELAELNPDHFEFPMHHFNFRFNRSELDSSLKHLNESLLHKDFGWVDSAFNSKEFRSEMDSLRKSLKGLKNTRPYLPGKLDFHFDTSAFNKSMCELKKNLEQMRLYHHDFGCDRNFIEK